MDKIKFLTDSACDLPEELAREYDIAVLPIPIAVDGVGYHERVDFTAQEFYKILLDAKTIPVTSHITHIAFADQYRAAFEQGYTHVVVTTINSKGSNMFEAANMAKTLFYDDCPEASGKLEVVVIDSKTYTIPYGLAQVEAAKLARAGKPCTEVVEFLYDFFDRLEIYFGVYSLEFAKKSGRISCAAAFVGDVLGLRPILSIIDGEMKIVDKVRGDKNVVPRLVDFACRDRKGDSPYLCIRALTDEVGEQAAALMEERTGQKPVGLYYAGACITINAGPRLAAVAVLGEKRTKK
ncbi:DegV family protein [Clostridiaceae bacterium NSJ-31]|uniref:DegV family protein n=3 Tax=Ligaoa zhengdingensis TaxID=2763658 RepID=A0A926E133_9FIRM|nr:DegV family protein [Ligaoa zhengdingensis]MBC8547209.1 DegV family protein [Ligaoa zhengdingensis]